MRGSQRAALKDSFPCIVGTIAVYIHHKEYITYLITKPPSLTFIFLYSYPLHYNSLISFSSLTITSLISYSLISYSLISYCIQELFFLHYQVSSLLHHTENILYSFLSNFYLIIISFPCISSLLQCGILSVV